VKKATAHDAMAYFYLSESALSILVINAFISSFISSVTLKVE